MELYKRKNRKRNIFAKQSVKILRVLKLRVHCINGFQFILSFFQVETWKWVEQVILLKKKKKIKPDYVQITNPFNDSYYESNNFNAKFILYYDKFKQVYIYFKSYTNQKLTPNHGSLVYHENNVEINNSHKKKLHPIVEKIFLFCLLLTFTLISGTYLNKNIEIIFCLNVDILLIKSTSSK